MPDTGWAGPSPRDVIGVGTSTCVPCGRHGRVRREQSLTNLDRDHAESGQRLDAEELRVSVGRLQHALALRDVIAQAKGVIRGLTGCADETAFTLLTRISRASNRTLPDVAEMLMSAAGPRGRLPSEIAEVFTRGLDLVREQGSLDQADLSTGSEAGCEHV
jgi:ANTAR domain